MSIQARFYEHPNFGGTSGLANLYYTSPVTTYLQISQGWLGALGLNDRISSLRLNASGWEAGGRTILFEHPQYRGRYAMFDASPGAAVDIPNLYAQNFNDRASSALVVRSGSKECLPLALGSLGTPDLRTQIANQVGSIPKLHMRGNVILTWDLWPSFYPSRKFVYVRVPVRVEVDNWFDYDAEIRFWIYLYVDGSGHARGSVDWFGAWVEGGILTGKILDRLMKAIPGQIGNVRTMVTNSLKSLSSFEFVGLYYLPGLAKTAGSVEDDVTVVFVKKW